MFNIIFKNFPSGAAQRDKEVTKEDSTDIVNILHETEFESTTIVEKTKNIPAAKDNEIKQLEQSKLELQKSCTSAFAEISMLGKFLENAELKLTDIKTDFESCLKNSEDYFPPDMEINVQNQEKHIQNQENVPVKMKEYPIPTRKFSKLEDSKKSDTTRKVVKTTSKNISKNYSKIDENICLKNKQTKPFSTRKPTVIKPKIPPVHSTNEFHLDLSDINQTYEVIEDIKYNTPVTFKECTSTKYKGKNKRSKSNGVEFYEPTSSENEEIIRSTSRSLSNNNSKSTVCKPRISTGTVRKLKVIESDDGSLKSCSNRQDNQRSRSNDGKYKISPNKTFETSPRKNKFQKNEDRSTPTPPNHSIDKDEKSKSPINSTPSQSPKKNGSKKDPKYFVETSATPCIQTPHSPKLKIKNLINNSSSEENVINPEARVIQTKPHLVQEIIQSEILIPENSSQQIIKENGDIDQSIAPLCNKDICVDNLSHLLEVLNKGKDKDIKNGTKPWSEELSKLSVQQMPQLNIRRALVTQKNPTININPEECIQNENVTNNNIRYFEIVSIENDIEEIQTQSQLNESGTIPIIVHDTNENKPKKVQRNEGEKMDKIGITDKSLQSNINTNKIPDIEEIVQQTEANKEKIKQRMISVGEELHLEVDVPSINTLKAIQCYLESKCAKINENFSGRNKYVTEKQIASTSKHSNISTENGKCSKLCSLNVPIQNSSNKNEVKSGTKSIYQSNKKDFDPLIANKKYLESSKLLLEKMKNLKLNFNSVSTETSQNLSEKSTQCAKNIDETQNIDNKKKQTKSVATSISDECLKFKNNEIPYKKHQNENSSKIETSMHEGKVSILCDYYKHKNKNIESDTSSNTKITITKSMQTDKDTMYCSYCEKTNQEKTKLDKEEQKGAMVEKSMQAGKSNISCTCYKLNENLENDDTIREKLQEKMQVMKVKMLEKNDQTGRGDINCSYYDNSETKKLVDNRSILTNNAKPRKMTENRDKSIQAGKGDIICSYYEQCRKNENIDNDNIPENSKSVVSWDMKNVNTTIKNGQEEITSDHYKASENVEQKNINKNNGNDIQDDLEESPRYKTKQIVEKSVQVTIIDISPRHYKSQNENSENIKATTHNVAIQNTTESNEPKNIEKGVQAGDGIITCTSDKSKSEIFDKYPTTVNQAVQSEIFHENMKDLNKNEHFDKCVQFDETEISFDGCKTIKIDEKKSPRIIQENLVLNKTENVEIQAGRGIVSCRCSQSENSEENTETSKKRMMGSKRKLEKSVQAERPHFSGSYYQTNNTEENREKSEKTILQSKLKIVSMQENDDISGACYQSDISEEKSMKQNIDYGKPTIEKSIQATNTNISCACNTSDNSEEHSVKHNVDCGKPSYQKRFQSVKSHISSDYETKMTKKQEYEPLKPKTDEGIQAGRGNISCGYYNSENANGEQSIQHKEKIKKVDFHGTKTEQSVQIGRGNISCNYYSENDDKNSCASDCGKSGLCTCADTSKMSKFNVVTSHFSFEPEQRNSNLSGNSCDCVEENKLDSVKKQPQNIQTCTKVSLQYPICKPELPKITKTCNKFQDFSQKHKLIDESTSSKFVATMNLNTPSYETRANIPKCYRRPEYSVCSNEKESPICQSTLNPEIQFKKRIKTRRMRHRSQPVKNQSSTSSTSSLSDKTLEDISLSDGEIENNCKCSTSIGEIHLCRYAHNIRKKVKDLKHNPEDMLQYEFGNQNIILQHQHKNVYSNNWVTYYVSKESDITSTESDSYDQSPIYSCTDHK